MKRCSFKENLIKSLAFATVLGLYVFSPSTALAEDEFNITDYTKPEYGIGTNAMYFKWEKDVNGYNTLVETTNLDKNITVNYNSENNFYDNYSKNSTTENTYGGVFYNKENENVGNIDGTFFNNNISTNLSSKTSYSQGGAIYNSYSTVGDINGSFIENSAESTGKSSYGKGGAISNSYGSINTIKSNFINNSIKSTATGASSTAYAIGGAILNQSNANISSIIGDFINNSVHAQAENGTARGYASAIYNGYTSKIGTINGDFINNRTIANGKNALSTGVIQIIYGEIGNISGNFYNNYIQTNSSESWAYGYGIITIEDVSSSINELNANFYNNYIRTESKNDLAFSGGGAIYNSSANIGNINSNFKNNKILSMSDSTAGAYGGAIYNRGTIGGIKADFINNSVNSNGKNSQSWGGAIYNFNTSIGNIAGNFINNFANNNTENHTDLTLGGAILNGAMATIGTKDENGNLIGGIINSNFLNNYAKANKGIVLGGAIYTDNDLNIIADNGISEFRGNYTQIGEVVDDNAIFVDTDNLAAKLSLIARNNGKIIMHDNINGGDGYTIAVKGDDTGALYLYNDFINANVEMGTVSLNTINNLAHNYNFNKYTLTDNTNFYGDVDLANSEMDRITANEYGEHQGNLIVSGLNLTSDAKSDVTEILFAESGLKDNVVSNVSTTDGNKFQTTAFTPIYKYNVEYSNKDDGGYFVFSRPEPSPDVNSGVNSGTSSSIPSTSVENYNPAVLGSTTTAVAGASGTMNTTFNYAFENANTFMNIPYLERVAMKDRNKYAMSLADEDGSMGKFSPLFQSEDETESVWFKPYTTFESIPLKNGPKVENISYGTLVGFDTELKTMRNGWDRVWTGYIGYNGASQSYAGTDSIQNGGLLGGTLTLYKGNFFNATTLAVGASVASNDTMYGHEDFTMLLSGIGNKTGYNLEFKDGKIILQPSMLIAYTFVNTFDFTNAAGVKIESKPFHAIQLSPGLKLIGNTKNGWQPYIGVNMVWNLMGETRSTANGVDLPSMSVKPYVQYGVGVQKRVKDNLTAYGQAMIQNGGRNGISLTGGIKWAIGKNK